MAADLSERVKTDMRLPRVLIMHVEEMANRVGIPKNAFFTIAAAKLAVELSKRYTRGHKREKMLRELELEVQKIFRAAREAE